MALATSCGDTDTSISLRHCHVSRQHHGRFWVSLFIEAHKRLKLENEEYLLRCDATAQIEQIKKLTLAVTDLALLGEPRIAYTLHTVPGYTTRGHSIMWVNVKQFWPVNVSEQRSDPKTTLRRGGEKMRFY